MCRCVCTHLMQVELRVAKSLAKHIRGQDLQTLLLHFNCYQIFQLFSTNCSCLPFFPFISTSNGQQRQAERKGRGGKGGGGGMKDRERERETHGARPWTPVLMGIISFYLRQLSLHSMLISEQRSTVPSKENVCVWKTPSHKQDKRENTYACGLSHPNLSFVLGRISDSETGCLDR